ncbi:unnamed protein product [Pedinophyceae sp. YPF-701]|nr:unnamed protein product [Pedinophyceae sp. YPF-701]
MMLLAAGGWQGVARFVGAVLAVAFAAFGLVRFFSGPPAPAAMTPPHLRPKMPWFAWLGGKRTPLSALVLGEGQAPADTWGAIHQSVVDFRATRRGGLELLTDFSYYALMLQPDGATYQRLEADLNGLNRHFTAYRGARANCGDREILSQTTLSLESAAMACTANPRCTFVSRDPSSGWTYFCFGKYGSFDEYSKGGYPGWWSLERVGCEDLTPDMAAVLQFAGRNPVCKRSCECPEGLFALEPCSATRDASCVECADGGVCPEAPGAVIVENFATASTKALHAVPLPESLRSELGTQEIERLAPELMAAFNPAVFEHDSKLYSVYRLTNRHLCAGGDGTVVRGSKQDLLFAWSLIGLCELDPATLLPVEGRCTSLHVPFRDMQGTAGYFESRAYGGIEDPRGISMGPGNGFLVSGTVNLGVKVNENFQTFAKMCLLWLEIEEEEEGYEGPPRIKFEKGMVFEHRHGRALSQDKNWMVSLDQSGADPQPDGRPGIHFVMFPMPPRVCRVNVATASCDFVEFSKPDLIRALGHDTEKYVQHLGPWHGGGALVRTDFGLLALVHQRKKQRQGSLYTHRMMLFDTIDPTVPIWASEPFRLPFVGVPDEDVQMATSLQPLAELPPTLRQRIVKDALGLAGAQAAEAAARMALVSWGVADCSAQLAVIELPIEQMRQAQRRYLDKGGEVSLQPARPVSARAPPFTLRNSRVPAYGAGVRFHVWSGPDNPWHHLLAEVIPLLAAWTPEPSPGVSQLGEQEPMKPLRRGNVRVVPLAVSDEAPPAKRGEGVEALGHVLMASNTAANAPAAVAVRAFADHLLRRPSAPVWVQFWDFGVLALPEESLEILRDDVDDIWVPSPWGAAVLKAAGVPPDHVFTLPPTLDRDSPLHTELRTHCGCPSQGTGLKDRHRGKKFRFGIVTDLSPGSGLESVVRAFFAAFPDGEASLGRAAELHVLVWGPRARKYDDPFGAAEAGGDTEQEVPPHLFDGVSDEDKQRVVMRSLVSQFNIGPHVLDVLVFAPAGTTTYAPLTWAIECGVPAIALEQPSAPLVVPDGSFVVTGVLEPCRQFPCGFDAPALLGRSLPEWPTWLSFSRQAMADAMVKAAHAEADTLKAMTEAAREHLHGVALSTEEAAGEILVRLEMLIDRLGESL